MLSIYLTNLAKYNNGELFGQWVNLGDLTDEELETITKEVLCGDEELFITDYEWDGVSVFNVGEYENIELLKIRADELSSLCEQELKKIRYLMSQVGYDFDGAMRNLEDCDIYEDMSLKDLAYDFVEEGLFGDIPDNIKNYLDYDAIARDLGFDYVEFEGDIFRAA